MSLKNRLKALERPQQRGIIDIKVLQSRGEAVARGEIQSMTRAELTALWQHLFNRSPHDLALKAIEGVRL